MWIADLLFSSNFWFYYCLVNETYYGIRVEVLGSSWLSHFFKLLLPSFHHVYALSSHVGVGVLKCMWAAHLLYIKSDICIYWLVHGT